MQCAIKRIVICTADDRYSTKGYWTLTDEANKAYCKKQKYDYIRIDTSSWSEKKRHPSWLKIQVVKDVALLKKYDIVVWVDSDVIINNHEARIEDFLGHKSLSHTIADFISDGDKSNSPCAGIFFLWAKHPQAIAFLESWNTWEYNGFDVVERLFQFYLNKHSKQYEQRILKCTYWPYKDSIRVIKQPSFYLVHNDQMFFHCANFIKNREAVLKEVFDRVVK